MFITFEGMDFCGKSTQVALLEEYLKNNGEKVHVIREPGDTEISEKIREVLLDKKNNNMVMETEILLFSAARAQLVREVIRPYLNKGYFVLSDRFHDSSTAYQGYGRGLSVDAIMNIHKLSIGETVPDLTFFIDTPLEVILQRKSKKTKIELDRIESSDISFYKRVIDGYREIASNDKRFRTINGNQPIKKIYSEIINKVNHAIEAKKYFR